MALQDWLPQNPLLGPPLPRGWHILWPWLEQTATGTQVSAELPKIPSLFRGPSSNESTALISLQAQPSAPAYENLESIEYPEGFDPDTFMPRKIVVHRKYRQRVS
jgi:hypothetical protein